MNTLDEPSRLTFWLLAGVLFALCACEDSVSPPSGVEEPFAAYGILNPRLIRQTMLVSPTSRLLLDYDDSIDALVASADVASGDRHVWQDSVVVGPRGQTDHIFYADFRPDFGSTHHVEIKRSDGAASTVEVAVPNEVEFDLEDDGTRLLRLHVIGEAIRVLGADVTYGVRAYGDSPVAFCDKDLAFYELPLDDEIEETPDGAIIEIDMYEHEQQLRYLYFADFRSINVAAQYALGLSHMKIEVVIGHESWAPPEGVFEPNVLSNPRTLSNVSNGFGFVGGGYNQDMRLWPSKRAVQDTKFADYLMRPPGDCLDLCSCGLFSDQATG